MVRGRRLFLVLLGGCLLGLLLLISPFGLRHLGAYLVQSDPPCHADIALVLAGDGYGQRIQQGAALVKQGFVPKVLVSGAPGFYGFHEDELATRYMVAKGYPEDWFLRVPHEAHSTREELSILLPRLHQMGVRRYALVTSNYHSHRSAMTARKIDPSLPFCMVAAPDAHFNPDNWWRDREGRKLFLYEWLKTAAESIGGA